MDIASIAAGLLGAKAAQTQTTLAARMMKMDAQADSAIVELLQVAEKGAKSLASAAAPGMGTVLDILA